MAVNMSCVELCELTCARPTAETRRFESYSATRCSVTTLITGLVSDCETRITDGTTTYLPVPLRD